MRKRAGKRLLTVGTDCALGKKYTALALTRAFRRRGLDADLRATGQTGILIAGSGVPIDAVVADFIAGAAEWVSPARTDEGWDIIEGQGSLFHASYAGVSLGLLHGAQPDALVLCHEPTRTHMRGLRHFPLPDLALCIERNIEAAQLTNEAVRCVGLSVNTAALDAASAADYLRRTADSLGLPCVDPVRSGVGALVDSLTFQAERCKLSSWCAKRSSLQPCRPSCSGRRAPTSKPRSATCAPRPMPTPRSACRVDGCSRASSRRFRSSPFSN